MLSLTDETEHTMGSAIYDLEGLPAGTDTVQHTSREATGVCVAIASTIGLSFINPLQTLERGALVAADPDRHLVH